MSIQNTAFDLIQRITEIFFHVPVKHTENTISNCKYLVIKLVE